MGGGYEMDFEDELVAKDNERACLEHHHDLLAEAEIALLRFQGRPVPEHLLEWERSQVIDVSVVSIDGSDIPF